MMKRIVLGCALMLWATGAAAHSPLMLTEPAHQAQLSAAPSQLVMQFKGNIRLTRVTLSRGDEVLDVDLGTHEGFISDYTLPLEVEGPGTYQVEWRGLGDDGHPMTGTFAFQVTAE